MVAPRVLVAIDGSTRSRATIAEVAARRWPSGSTIEVLTVIHSRIPQIPDPAFALAAAHVEEVHQQERAAPELLLDSVARLQRTLPDVSVTSNVLEGIPATVIVEEAERLNADEVIVGSHGHGPVRQSLLGSVSLSVAQHARCSVHIVRPRRSAGLPAPQGDTPH